MREDHINCQIDRVSAIGVDQDHQRGLHRGKDVGIMSLIGETGMIIMLTSERVVITVS